MNYYIEIFKQLEQFSADSPVPDRIPEYLSYAEELSELYSEAVALEIEGVEESPRLIEIHKRVLEIVNGNLPKDVR